MGKIFANQRVICYVDRYPISGETTKIGGEMFALFCGVLPKIV